jgi:hypothetical protein
MKILNFKFRKKSIFSIKIVRFKCNHQFNFVSPEEQLHLNVGGFFRNSVGFLPKNLTNFFSSLLLAFR